MTAFVAKLVIKPEKREEFERLQIELRELTYKHEPDTPVYEFIRSRDDPNTYLVVSTFTDEAAFETHQKSDFHEDMVTPILACLAEEMELTFYDVLGDPRAPRKAG